jgi:protein O-mannosyl-transferase
VSGLPRGAAGDLEVSEALNRGSTELAGAKRLSLHPIFIIIVFGILIFAPVCTFGFIGYDDSYNISANPVYNPPEWTGILQAWHRPYLSMYIPATYTAWGAIAELAWGDGRLDPHLFHLANLLTHVLGGVLVYAILRQLRFGDLPACLGALLFVVHPVQVEPVAWVTGLKDVLSGTLGLLSIWLYLRQRKTVYFLATIAFILAMLAKPTAAIVPVLVLILDFCVLKIDWHRSVKALSVWFILAAADLVVSKLVQPATAIHVQVIARPGIAGDAVAFYLVHIIAPLHLAVDYGRSPLWLLHQPIIWVNWLIPVGIGLMLWRHARKIAWPAFLIFVAALFPTLGLTTFDFQQHSTVADRYLYLAMLGVAMIVAAVAQRWPKRGVMAILIFLVFFSCQTLFHEWVWRDTEGLFRQTLAVNPSSDIANNAIGMIVGDRAMTRNDPVLREESITYFERAMASNPTSLPAHYNLATALLMAGQKERAARELDVLRQLDPDGARMPQMDNLLSGHGKWLSVGAATR